MGEVKGWDLVLAEPSHFSGPENMAVDETILNSFDIENSKPVLRIYGWEPPALSVGRFQKTEGLFDKKALEYENISVVRRITGGGSIFHTKELTYSLVLPKDYFGGNISIKDTYRYICSFIIEAYRSLGLDASFAVVNNSTGKLGEKTNICFAGREIYDICLGSKKIGGNAQRHLKGLIFQHGSIPLDFETEKHHRLFTECPDNLKDSCTSLKETGIETSFDEFRAVFIESFKKTFNTELDHRDLREDEKSTFNYLLENKYLNDNWNLNGKEEPLKKT